MGAVVIEDDRVLLVRRGHEPRMGEWSIPGGAVEVGETLEQAVVREVREETGLTVTPRVLLKTFDRIDRDAEGRVRFHYVLIDFLCVPAPGAQPTPRAASDAAELRWVAGATLGSSKELTLPDWTLEVVEAGWRHAQRERRMQQEQGLSAPS